MSEYLRVLNKFNPHTAHFANATISSARDPQMIHQMSCPCANRWIVINRFYASHPSTAVIVAIVCMMVRIEKLVRHQRLIRNVRVPDPGGNRSGSHVQLCPDTSAPRWHVVVVKQVGLCRPGFAMRTRACGSGLRLRGNGTVCGPSSLACRTGKAATAYAQYKAHHPTDHAMRHAGNLQYCAG